MEGFGFRVILLSSESGKSKSGYYEKSKVFINLAHAFEVNLGDSKVDYEGTPEREDREIKSNGFFAVGMGYQFLNRFSTEFRYCTNRNLLGNYVDWDTSHKGFAIILGYKLF